MHDDLILRLRTFGAEGFPVATEAADALEAMQADAERYRWIRKADCSEVEWLVWNAEDLDAAIDAARKQP